MIIADYNRKQQGFHVVWLLLVIIVICAIGFVGFWVFKKNDPESNNQNFGPNYGALSTCNETPLTALPADLARLEYIAPLGNVDPPDHTLPTDHLYMMYPYGETDKKDIFAPGDSVIISISHGGEYKAGQLINADYSIDMYACRELKLRVSHMDILSDKLLAAVGGAEFSDEDCQTSQQADRELKSCTKELDLPVTAGEQIAQSDGWDFWATLQDFVSPNVVSPDYYHNVDAVCPLDYFTADLKAQLYNKLRRDGQPKCGEAYQDQAGTLQGGWFGHKDPQQAKTDWSSHFSLTNNSLESGVGQLATSGMLTGQDFMYRFTPKDEGTINREPSQTSKGVVYCYQHEGDKRFPNGRMAGDGKVLLELIDDHTMQIEHQDGICVAGELFATPKVYYR